MRLLLAAAALGALLVAAPAPAQSAATPLFASDEPIRLTIRGPIDAIAKNAKSNEARPAALTLVGAAPETHAIRLTPRGLTRRRKETCPFPPLRIEFAAKPAAGSLFARQGRLKLVTHCRPGEAFQQHLLLEYLAYRINNLLTPASFRARLASIDYLGDDGRPITTRYGLLLEDKDDIGRRIGQRQAITGNLIAAARLDPRGAARLALFEYMIGNLDWSMRAGPDDEGCCHNSRLFAAPGAAPTGANLLPVPYDFDFSGLVDAPYAVPPEGFKIRSVKSRVYQGFCRHNGELMVAAAEMRGHRGEIDALVGRLPGLEPKARAKAAAYLGGFFDDIATDREVEAKLIKSCLK